MQRSLPNINTSIQDGCDKAIYYNRLGKELLATEPERASDYFSQALATSIDIQNFKLIADSHFLSGEAFMELGQSNEALVQYITALSVAETHQLPTSKILNGLYETYKAFGDFENALKYHEHYHTSIQDIDKENKYGEDSRAFFRHIVHDIKEPVRIATGYHTILTQKIRESGTTQYDEYLDYIQSATERIGILVSSFGTYVNLDASTNTRSAVNLNEVIHVIKYNFKKTLSDKNVEIIHDELPVIDADFKQMTYLFEYLIDNAIKYNEKDKPIVKIIAAKKNGSYSIALKDNGVGIEETKIQNLLDISQAPRKDNKYPKSSGMSLLICKKIVQQYKGNIWIESVPKEGTTVYFTIPDS